MDKPLISVLAIVSIIAVACPHVLQAQQYVYSDDFSTDQAILDSYWHSEFVDVLPDPWSVEGFLRYESYISVRTLTFYMGSGHDAYAWLRYKLPLEGGSSGVEYASALVEFDLVDSWGGGWIQCGCSLEGGSPWEWPSASDIGHCAFDFAASSPPETVFISFRGCSVSVDDLVITMERWTSVEGSSWARIKHLFGGPPNIL